MAAALLNRFCCPDACQLILYVGSENNLPGASCIASPQSVVHRCPFGHGASSSPGGIANQLESHLELWGYHQSFVHRYKYSISRAQLLRTHLATPVSRARTHTTVLRNVASSGPWRRSGYTCTGK